MTAQIPEVLILDGVETTMTFCPPLPDRHPRIVETQPEAILRGDVSSLILYSTACWRRYQGTWEIKDGRFYLVDLRGQFRLEGQEPLLADWFSGVIRIPRGKMLHYVHMGFGSVYEQELHIKIERGAVVDSRVIDNRGKKFDERELGLKNLPGGENRFPGDDEL
jgi:hypothetical protein